MFQAGYEHKVLGIDSSLLNNPKVSELLPKAEEITNQLDELQYAGADPKELADVYNRLPPTMKVLVKRLKEQKISQAEKDILKSKAENRMIGSSVDRINSPITKAAKNILLETLQSEQQQ